MALTEHEKGRLRRNWREFAELAYDAASIPFDSDAFRRKALEAPDWQTPFESDADAFFLFGLARIAKGYVRGKITDQARRRPLLLAAASEVLHLIPPTAAVDAPQRRLPYKD